METNMTIERNAPRGELLRNLALGLGSLVGTVSVAGSVLLLAYVHGMSLTGFNLMFS